MIWFTSDTHFSHNNILHYTDREKYFKNVNEMNKALIHNINDCVSKKDTLYHLGDISLGKGKHWTSSINNIFSNIKCENIHVVLGNHDPSIRSEHVNNKHFKSAEHYCEINIGGYVPRALKKFNICMYHYPMTTWNRKCPIHLHGHCHGKLGFITSPFKEGYIRYDVGVDSEGLNYRPISVIQLMTNYVSQIPKDSNND